MTTMSFIKKIKKKGKTYAIEVEGYRDKDGKVKHKYLRYLGTLDENTFCQHCFMALGLRPQTPAEAPPLAGFNKT